MRNAIANDVILAFEVLLDAQAPAAAGDPRVLRARRALERYRLKVVKPAFCWHCGKPVGESGCVVGGCPLGLDL